MRSWYSVLQLTWCLPIHFSIDVSIVESRLPPHRTWITSLPFSTGPSGNYCSVKELVRGGWGTSTPSGRPLQTATAAHGGRRRRGGGRLLSLPHGGTDPEPNKRSQRQGQVLGEPTLYRQRGACIQKGKCNKGRGEAEDIVQIYALIQFNSIRQWYRTIHYHNLHRIASMAPLNSPH